MGDIRRRDFITLLGGAATAWPLAARAQQPAMPVIGFLNATSPDTNADVLLAFHRGLKETGFVEGENVAIVYRWAENQLDRLPELAAELVHRRVAMIAALSHDPAFAAKAATTTIPIVFLAGQDPVKLGLVASLARPGGNLTGVNFFVSELGAKRLELLRELAPGIARVAVFLNSASPAGTESTQRDVEAAASAMRLQIQVLDATTSREIEPPSQALRASDPTPYSSAPVPFSRAGVSNSPNWRHATPSPRSMEGANIPKSAG
jgi:putative ABC transport system substrate-binding protein